MYQTYCIISGSRPPPVAVKPIGKIKVSTLGTVCSSIYQVRIEILHTKDISETIELEHLIIIYHPP